MVYLSSLSSPPTTPTKLVCFSVLNHASQSPIPRGVSKGCKLVGCGSGVPSLQISNDDLAKVVDTSDEWIASRTGIRRRRVLSGGENLTTLAVEAAGKALEMAKVDPNDVDLILMCTSTPDDLFGNAPQISKQLGCKTHPLAYNITAACSGFILGLISASSHIKGAGFHNVLVIGADAVSRFVDWTDRRTCILFGDAAGAVLVQACNSEEDGLFAFDLHSDGDGHRHVFTLCLSPYMCIFLMRAGCCLVTGFESGNNLSTCRGKTAHLSSSFRENEANNNNAPNTKNGFELEFPPRLSSYSCLQMNGKEVFRFAVRSVPLSVESALQKAGLPMSSIDWLLLHQANQRIIDSVAARLEVPSEKVISNVAEYGNTSAASIPLALDESVRSGKVKAGHIIAAAGFGAGLTWGSAILKWG